MAADETAVFRPAIREIQEAGSGWCVSFIDEEDEGMWVQVSEDLLNFAYPYDQEPKKVLADRNLKGLEGLETVAWEAGKFAALRLTDLREYSMAHAVDEIFAYLLYRPPGFKITVEVFKAA